VSNERVISEWRIGKDLEGSGGGLILRYCPLIRLEGRGKSRTTVRGAGLRAEVWTRERPPTQNTLMEAGIWPILSQSWMHTVLTLSKSRHVTKCWNCAMSCIKTRTEFQSDWMWETTWRTCLGWHYNIKVEYKAIGLETGDWINLAHTESSSRFL
jgi:hypothetical protein